MINEKIIKNPQPRLISNGVAGGIEDPSPFTQFCKSIGVVINPDPVGRTAKVAPVSATLRVNIMMAPENNEYFVRGNITVRNTVNGLPPKILEASSKSIGTLSIAAAIALTKYG